MSPYLQNLPRLNRVGTLLKKHWPGFLFQESLVALLFFGVVSSLMLFPLFPHFFDRLATGGDAYEYIWKLWWFKHTLLETGQSPWIAPNIYYPHGYLLAYGETTAANTILGLPLVIFWGEIPTYNFLILFNTILSGFGMFLLARQVSGSFWAGLLAGIIFAYAPFRRLQFVHLNIVTTQWLPFIFFFLERFVSTRKPGHGLAAGVCFTLNALASWYYATAGILFMLIWGLIRLRPLKEFLKRKETWLALGLFAGSALVLTLPFAWPYAAILGNPYTGTPMDNSNYFAASPTDYLVPSPFQFLWGGWIWANLLRKPDPGEFIIGIGLVTWLFALYSLRYAPRRIRRPWLLIALVSIVLSFGLTFHMFGRQVVVPVSTEIAGTFNELLDHISLNYALDAEPFTLGRDDGLVVPMPALLMRWFVPVFGRSRTWTRFGFMALFALAVLAALGAAAWQQRELRRYSLNKQRAAWLVVLGLALFELWWAPLTTVTPVLARPVDHWLRSQPGDQAIIEYPLVNSFSGQQLVYTWTHGRPVVHGYGIFLGFMMGRRHPELLTFPESAALEQLDAWTVRYVLIDTEGPGAEEAQQLLQEIETITCLHPATVQDTVHVFELVGCSQ